MQVIVVKYFIQFALKYIFLKYIISIVSIYLKYASFHKGNKAIDLLELCCSSVQQFVVVIMYI